MGTIVTVILILVLAAFAFRAWIKKQATLQAAQVVTKMYAVWAEMGPYENGAASANSLRYAFSATNTNKSANLSNIVNMVKHAEAYDADPNAWERLRHSSLSGPRDKEFADQLAMARGMAATEEMNDGMFRNAGFKACFENDANGNLTVVFRDIHTREIDSRFKDHDEAMAFAIATDIGNELLNDESFESEMLVTFINTLYRDTAKRDTETPQELGDSYNFIFNYSKEHPDEESSKMFIEMNDSWIAVRRSDKAVRDMGRSQLDNLKK